MRARKPVHCRCAPSKPAADDAALRRLALWATRYTPTASPCEGIWSREWRRRIFPRHRRRRASVRRRGEDYSPILPPGSEVSACRRGLPSLRRPARHGRCRAFTPRPLLVLPSGQEAKRCHRCPSKRCGFRRKPARRCAGSVLSPSARCSTNPARRLPRGFPPNCCGVLTRRSAASTSRSSLSSRRRSITRCVICSSRSSRRKPPWRWQRRLMQTLAHVLTRDDVGARALAAVRSIASMAKSETIDIALTLPTRNVSHVARMIALKLEAQAATEDAGFGFEAIGLAVTRAETMPVQQHELIGDDDQQCRQNGALRGLDRYAAATPRIAKRTAARTGRQSYSRARRSFAAGRPVKPRHHGWSRSKRDRCCLLPLAEPAEEVMALIPDGPPRRFRWRGVIYEVAGSQGPERIGAEWWRLPSQ